MRKILKNKISGEIEFVNIAKQIELYNGNLNKTMKTQDNNENIKMMMKCEQTDEPGGGKIILMGTTMTDMAKLSFLQELATIYRGWN